MAGYGDINLELALQIKKASAVEFTEPPGYLSALKGFQKKGVAFLYTIKSGAIFDTTGSGKTHIVMALMCLLKSRDELGSCLYVVPAADLLSKVEELGKFTNTLNFAAASGKLSNRISVYNTSYDVILVSYEVLRGQDFEYLKALNFNTVILDESHVFRNSATKTAEHVLSITKNASRVVTMSATPIQMSLVDVWAQSRSWNQGIFGTESSFKRRYVIEEEEEHNVRRHRFKKRRIVGYRNLSELKQILDPFFLRRTIADIEDELPALLVDTRWGSLLPAQRSVYEELRKGTVQLICNGQRHEARKHIHSMVMCVNSTAALGVEADYSWKFDWLIAELHRDASGFSGSMANDKVVVFAQHKATLRVLSKRLLNEGIKFVVMTGDDSKESRQQRRRQFWEDEDTRVLIGTTAIECSMNLQVARFLVAVDSLPNPQRVQQLVGRIRRIGSKHKTVVFVMLLTENTFEEKLHARLEKRQAVVNKVFEEESDIFSALSDFELTQLFSD